MMDIIIMFLIFFNGIFWHEIGHIAYFWVFFKEWPMVRFRKTNIQIIPTVTMSNLHKSAFLGSGIIVGMLSFTPLFFFFPEEATYAMIAYLISCGMDFHTLIQIHIQTKKGEAK